MTALLERVSRAICLARGDDPDRPVYRNGCPESGVLYYQWMIYREEARAALDEIPIEDVTGRFKTSHSWALQNQPRLSGVLNTLVDSNRLDLLFKVSGVGRLSFSS